MIDTLNNYHTDLRFINNDYSKFLFTTLKVHGIQNLSSNTIPFTFFFAIIFSEVPMWSTQPSKSNDPPKNDSRRVLKPEVTKLDGY